MCMIYYVPFLVSKYSNQDQNRVQNRKKSLILSSSQIHGLHTRLNILGKQSNRGSGGELAIQSCELIETEIGKRDTNGEE